jgi:sec-independent protein translocase protein TatA
MDLGLPELIIILLIVLLLFGGTRLPKLSRSIGESLKNLREGFEGKATPTEETKPKQEKKA